AAAVRNDSKAMEEYSEEHQFAISEINQEIGDLVDILVTLERKNMLDEQLKRETDEWIESVRNNFEKVLSPDNAPRQVEKLKAKIEQASGFSLVKTMLLSVALAIFGLSVGKVYAASKAAEAGITAQGLSSQILAFLSLNGWAFSIPF
ncbi:MAG: hypothetical protein JRI96_14390, partial [Deltaproteobacteria bacterium]|nr:hypothetical protein [Deltaproteobacteria bacterium]